MAKRYDSRITVQRPSDVRDDIGGADRTWVDVGGNIPARVVPRKADEMLDAEGLRSVAVYDVKMRQRALAGELSSAMRVIWTSNNDLVLNVTEIMDGGQRAREIHLQAEMEGR